MEKTRISVWVSSKKKYKEIIDDVESYVWHSDNGIHKLEIKTKYEDRVNHKTKSSILTYIGKDITFCVEKMIITG